MNVSKVNGVIVFLLGIFCSLLLAFLISFFNIDSAISNFKVMKVIVGLSVLLPALYGGKFYIGVFKEGKDLNWPLKNMESDPKNGNSGSGV